MKFKTGKEKIIFLGRLLVGGIFCYSGFSKLIQPAEYFEIAIGFYQVVPDPFVHGVALVVPWVELIFGTYLLLGYWVNGSSSVLAILTGMFQLILAQALVRHLPIDECGCFGDGFIHLSLYQSFALDTLIALFLLRLAFVKEQYFSIDNIFSH